MATFTKEVAERFEVKSKTEPYCTDFVWYNQYLEFTYNIPMDKLDTINTPQWSHVKLIAPNSNGMLTVIVAVFNNEMLLGLEYAVKYPLLTIKLKD